MSAASNPGEDSRQGDMPSTLPYHLMASIRELIITNEYRPGEKIREEDLKSRFRSSRSPIREALRLLELKGLLKHTPRRGFRVRLMTDKEIDDLYHLRSHLESYSIRMLSSCSEVEPLVSDLRSINHEMKVAAEQGRPRDYLVANSKFHALILDYSNNIPLRATLDHLNEIAEPLRYNALSDDLARSKSHRFHVEIVEAITSHDFDKAASLMGEHVLTSLPNVKRAYLKLVGGV